MNVVGFNIKEKRVLDLIVKNMTLSDEEISRKLSLSEIELKVTRKKIIIKLISDEDKQRI